MHVEMCGLIPMSFTDVVRPSRFSRVHATAHRAVGVNHDVLELAPLTADGWHCGRCKQFIFYSMLAIVSVGVADLLILQRVVILWEHRPVSPYLPLVLRAHVLTARARWS